MLSLVLAAITYLLIVPPFLVRRPSYAAAALLVFILFQTWTLQAYLLMLKQSGFESSVTAGIGAIVRGLPILILSSAITVRVFGLAYQMMRERLRALK